LRGKPFISQVAIAPKGDAVRSEFGMELRDGRLKFAAFDAEIEIAETEAQSSSSLRVTYDGGAAAELGVPWSAAPDAANDGFDAPSIGSMLSRGDVVPHGPTANTADINDIARELSALSRLTGDENNTEPKLAWGTYR
jgi:hypothetical protein